MKKILCIFVLFVGGCEQFHARIINVSPSAVVIDTGSKKISHGVSIDIWDSNSSLPIGRAVITNTSPDNSSAAIVNKFAAIKPGMLCTKTTSETLKAEKKAYKAQKKALKRQYKLTKIKSKENVYDSLSSTVADSNDIISIKAGLIKVDKK